VWIRRKIKMNKFKVGDIVKIKGYNSYQNFRISEITKSVSSNQKYTEYTCVGTINEKEEFWICGEYLELISKKEFNNDNKSIHITFKGNNTYAVLKDGKNVVNKVKVSLYHGDEYNVHIGTQEAINKLLNINEKNVGMLDNLTTTNKTNFVDAINENAINKVKEVRRIAEVGEYVKIIKAGKLSTPTTNGIPDYKVGDILKIIPNDSYDEYNIFRRYSTVRNYGLEKVLCEDEYVVLEGYKNN